MSFKELFSLLRQLLTVFENVDRIKADNVKLREDVHQLALIVERLQARVENADRRVEHERLKLEHERLTTAHEQLTGRLEDTEKLLSEFKRRLLPPASVKKVKGDARLLPGASADDGS